MTAFWNKDNPPSLWNVRPPYAPQLPLEFDAQGNLVQPQWKNINGKYTARLNPQGNGFLVRRLNLNHPEGKNHDDDWPAKCILGPPSGLSWESVPEKFGLQVLEDAGFINFQEGQGGQRAAFDLPEGRLERSQSWYGGLLPIFERKMWRNTSKADYELMLPILRLATSILTDPETLCFLHAVAAQGAGMRIVQDPTVGECKVMIIPPVLTAAESAAVFTKIYEMRDYVSFGFQVLGECFGRTTQDPGQTRPDLRDGNLVFTCGSWITISSDYLSVLHAYRDGLHPQRIQEIVQACGITQATSCSTFDSDSALQRTIMFGATTIVHEFVHAFSMAYFERPWGAGEYPNPPADPFFPGKRSNELGLAFEYYLYGGVPSNHICYIPGASNDSRVRQALFAPFGMNILKNYDEHQDDTGTHFAISRAMGFPDWSKAQLYFPVPQKHVHDVFTREMWVQKVQRFGIMALRPPLYLDWQTEVWGVPPVAGVPQVHPPVVPGGPAGPGLPGGAGALGGSGAAGGSGASGTPTNPTVIP